MKSFKPLAIMLIGMLPLAVFSQNWWVYFTDKPKGDFDPKAYFDEKAIQRRLDQGIPLNDVTDWPVNEQYVQKVASLVDSNVYTSRWFNALAVHADYNQIELVKALPFVAGVEEVFPGEMQVASNNVFDTILEKEDQNVLIGQLASMQGELFRQAGIDGKGIRVAIFDVGFPGAKENPAFSEIIAEGRLKGSKDFTKKKGEDVFWGKSHGTNVWSCIAGKVGEKQTGLATGAEFLLAKTEVNAEPFSEEVHWLAAAEWADKNGADIINSSLGYTKERYFPWWMDGKKSFVARAANMAAGKGILVVNAAGNEGDDSWHVIGTPADADSVLSIGGINPETGYHTSFSSYGPTADKRMKPNVCAFGHAIVSNSSGLGMATGTSFASPLVAGFAACAMQASHGQGGMKFFREMEKSGNLYPYFDYAHGFGIPQAGYFMNPHKPVSEPTFAITETSDSLYIILNKEKLGVIASNEEAAKEDISWKKKYLYYNLMNSKGVIDSYYVVEIESEKVLELSKEVLKGGEVLNVHFEGYTKSFKL